MFTYATKKLQKWKLIGVKKCQVITNAGYYYKFTRELDGHISLYSHTPHFCEEVPFSRICDYFRKPVYRRSADV